MKKVTYKIEQFKSITIEVETEEQEKQIEELNRDFERTDRQDRRIKAKTESLDQMYEAGYEPIDESLSPEEKYIENEENATLKKKIEKALGSLAEKQRTVVYKSFWEDKTLREIGKEMGIDNKTVYESLEAAKKKLKKLLKNF